MKWYPDGLLSTFGRWFDGGSNARRLELLLDTPVAEGLQPTPSAADSAPLTVPSVATLPVSLAATRRHLSNVFDSAHPVRTRDGLFGRKHELDQLLSAVLDNSQHSVIHGARGSGKTSLARVFGDHADEAGVVVIYMACEPEASFSDLLRPYLQAIPPSALRPGTKDAFARAVEALPDRFGPRTLVELVSGSVAGQIVLIFDEFDRIDNAAVTLDVAAAMKLLSDAIAPMLFVVVGMSHSVVDLVDAHPSLRRHMRVVPVGRITASSIDALIDSGERAAGIRFSADARTLIRRASCGSPFHLRLFCHGAALAAAERGTSQVAHEDVIEGLRAAYDHWKLMNEVDGEAFGRLVGDRGRRDMLERIARAGASGDGIGGDGAASETIRLVGPALFPVEEGGGQVVFRDSVAPQFLIARIILAEMAETPLQLVKEKVSDAASR